MINFFLPFLNLDSKNILKWRKKKKKEFAWRGYGGGWSGDESQI